MSSYFKLFGSMLDSTIWRESYPTKILWVTMLAMADQDGVVEAALPGLVDRAKITREECERGLEVLMAPDPDSRSSNDDGRRVVKVDGGWLIVNYEKYRDRMSREDRNLRNAERQARFRDRQKSVKSGSVTDSNARDVTVTEVTTSSQIRSDQAHTRTYGGGASENVGEDFGPQSWDLAKDVWTNAGPWPGGENMGAARKKFEAKINASNWPAFIQGLDWAVTTSINRGKEGRQYLGVLCTFIDEKKWMDQIDPNAKAPAPPEVPKIVSDHFGPLFESWPKPMEGHVEESREDALRAFSQVDPEDYPRFCLAFERRIRTYKNTEGTRDERRKYLGMFRNFCSKWREWLPVDRPASVEALAAVGTTDEDDE